MSSLGIFDKETRTYKKVADLSKTAVIDSSMSDSSTNAVQNKVVKSYVDTRTTLDTSMSDSSTNAVQNKVVKSYVDTRTTLDTSMSDSSTNAVQNKVVKSYVDTRTTFDAAMSDTSANAVQNKVVKSYVDTRTTLDTAMSDTSANAVQNKVVKSYVDGKFKQKLLARMGGDGKTSYCQLCTIKINKAYINSPIEITVQERSRTALDRLTVLFESATNIDPNIISFKVFGEYGDWYISKRAASTWVIYGRKNEPWGNIEVVDYIGHDGINVTWDVTGVTAMPDSKTKAVWGCNVGHAVSADSASSVAWNNVTGKPSTYTPSSHTHTKSQIADFPSSLPANGGNSDTANSVIDYNNADANIKIGYYGNGLRVDQIRHIAAFTGDGISDIRIKNVPKGELKSWLGDATTSDHGLMTPAMVSKLNGIADVVNNQTTTEAGYALDARQANPNLDGTLAKQISDLNGSLNNTFTMTYNIDELKNGIFWVNGYEETVGQLPFPNDHMIIIQVTYNYGGTTSIQVAIGMNSSGINGIKKRFYQEGKWEEWRY